MSKNDELIKSPEVFTMKFKPSDIVKGIWTGRTYIILKPILDDPKSFHPSALARHAHIIVDGKVFLGWYKSLVIQDEEEPQYIFKLVNNHQDNLVLVEHDHLHGRVKRVRPKIRPIAGDPPDVFIRGG